MSTIKTLADLNESSPYAWPGGYPVAFYIPNTGVVMCYDCVEAVLFSELDDDDDEGTVFESEVEDGDQEFYGGVMCDGCNRYIVEPMCPECGNELFDDSALMNADSVDASLMHRRCAAKLVCEHAARRIPGRGIEVVATKEVEHGWDHGTPWYANVGTVYAYR